MQPHIPGDVATWPHDDLEHLGECPVCRSSRRETRYKNLTDTLFHVAPGAWEMHACRDCGLLHLDPRPTEASIARAYSDYYTHKTFKPMEPPASNLTGRVLQGLQNDYLHHYWGLKREFRIPGGRWVLVCLPGFRRAIRYECRHLHPPFPGARLLDLGCGSGAFLAEAAALGWRADGLEPDPQAVAAGLKRTIPIRQGGLPDTGVADNTYDAVTMSHVIEHIHDPIAALKEVYRILKPGGMLWVSTPNAAGASHRAFGRHSRGLEPPRHLVIFSFQALLRTFSEAGFVSVCAQKPKLASDWYFQSSLQLLHKHPTPLSPTWRLKARISNLRALFCRAAGEELCMTGQKPHRT